MIFKPLSFNPPISVIVLCFNHERFVGEAIQSVIDQTYNNLQIIVVDDASTDNSLQEIEKMATLYNSIEVVRNLTNIGNCKSFNQALELATGELIVDLAADDVLLPERLEQDVKQFLKLSPRYGVLHSNVEFIDEKGNSMGVFHSDDTYIPQGEIYADLVERHFVSTPSMTIKRSVLDDIAGYDEELAYEDFDFWIRSGRDHYYSYNQNVLTKKRVLKGSKSTQFKNKHAFDMFRSTLLVCKKIKDLNKTKREDKALAIRIRYEMKQAYIYNYFDLVLEYLELLSVVGTLSASELFLQVCAEYKIDLAWGYRLLQRK